MNVAELRIGGKTEKWRELGFEIREDGVVMVGAIRLELVPSTEQGAIASWALDAAGVPSSIDGLATDQAPRGGRETTHPNGVSGIDHIVVLTPSLARTTAAFEALGVECRRVRDAGGDVRQGFFIFGDVLVEVVEGPGAGPEKPARFWGITLVVQDVKATATLLGERLGEVKDAVQPGRRIATVRREASDGLPLALITPRIRAE